MPNPIAIQGLASPALTNAGSAKATGSAPAVGDDFASVFREQLDAVNKIQSEADANVQKLLTGESQSVTDVFSAARKAQVAFTMLLEIRNKLVDAYQELQNLRV